MSNNRVAALVLAGLVSSTAIADSGAGTEPGLFDGFAEDVLRDLGYRDEEQQSTEDLSSDSQGAANQSDQQPLESSEKDLK